MEGAPALQIWFASGFEGGGERLWRFEDFPEAPIYGRGGKALSRLTRQGSSNGLSKRGLLPRRQTAFGKSLPSPAALPEACVSMPDGFFRSGIAAANLLAFTTQSAKRGEVATTALSLPRKTDRQRTR